MFKMKGYIMIIAHVLALLVQKTQAVDSNCNFYQELQLDQTYYLYQPEYPNRYRGAHSCQWIAKSPVNTQIQLYCENIDIPQSPACETDRLMVSTTGGSDFQNGQYYCGKGSITINSEKNQISVGFYSQYNTKGGTFLCSIKAFKSDNNNNCDCGWHNMKRIVGGVNTLINEYPMMAALIDFDLGEAFCGATIIANFYAVTAAHCLIKRQELVNRTGLLVGDWNLNSGSDTTAASLYHISKVMIHPNYQSKGFFNDIAITKTSSPIIWSSKVGPACLPFSYATANFEGVLVTALGWGATGFGDAPSSILQKVDLEWLPYDVCKQSEPTATQNQFCTYGKGKDSCQGDSGGPDLWQSTVNSRIQLLGIISYGTGCALNNAAGMNTRVSQYLNWIQSQTPEVVYCVKY